jgi:hypothetical protein
MLKVEAVEDTNKNKNINGRLWSFSSRKDVTPVKNQRGIIHFDR